MKSGGLGPKRVYGLHCSSCLAQLSLSVPVRALICFNGLDLTWRFHPQPLSGAQELHLRPALGLQSLPELCCRSISLQPNICPSFPDGPIHPCLLDGSWTYDASLVFSPVSRCSWLGSLDGHWTWFITSPCLGWALLLVSCPVSRDHTLQDCILVSESIACAGVTLSSQLVPSHRAALLWLLPDSASAGLRMNPANTFLNAEGAVQVDAVAIPSGVTQITFHMIRQHSFQPWAWWTLGNICRLRWEERAAFATILTTLTRSSRITHQANFSDRSVQVKEVEQSLSPLPGLLALWLNFKGIRTELRSSPGQCVLAIGSYIHPSCFTREFIRWPGRTKAESKHPPCCRSCRKDAGLTLDPDPRWNLSLTHGPCISSPIVWKPISKLFSQPFVMSQGSCAKFQRESEEIKGNWDQSKR